MEKRLTHGGDWQSYLDKYGEMTLDFSANVSPLLPSWFKPSRTTAPWIIPS